MVPIRLQYKHSKNTKTAPITTYSIINFPMHFMHRAYTHMVYVETKGWIFNESIPLFPYQDYTDVFGISSKSVFLDVRNAIDLTNNTSVTTRTEFQ